MGSSQLKPARDFLLLASRGHLLGQRRKDLFLEAEFKEFFLVGFADDFNLIELTAAKSFQDPLLVMLNDF